MVTESAAGALADVPAIAEPQWVVFVCAGDTLATPLNRTRAILTPRACTRLPGCGPEVCGLIGVRGHVVTVFDLGVLLRMSPSREVPDYRILLLDVGERRVGVVVDRILSVTGATVENPCGGDILEAGRVEPLDVLGGGRAGDRAFLALDLERILVRRLA